MMHKPSWFQRNVWLRWKKHLFYDEQIISNEKWVEPIYKAEIRHSFFTQPTNVDDKVVDRIFISLFLTLFVLGTFVEFVK